MERGAQSRNQGIGSWETDIERHQFNLDKMEEFNRTDSICRRSFREQESITG